MKEQKIIEIPEEYLDVYVVGDIHGEFDTLVFNITQKHKITDAAVIIAGDVGIGFEKPMYYENTYNRLKERLEKNNIIIYGIRGNHDDPEYFNGSLKLDFPRFKTLEDYCILKKWDREILCVGGAVSIDQEWRRDANKVYEDQGSSKRLWWPSEIPTYLDDKDIDKLPGRYYCVISHEAPISFLPVITRSTDGLFTEEVYNRILKSRNYLESILWHCKPFRWYYGHYHESHSESNGVTKSRCLGIQEFMRIPLEEEYDIKENPETKDKENKEGE